MFMYKSTFVRVLAKFLCINFAAAACFCFDNCFNIVCIFANGRSYSSDSVTVDDFSYVFACDVDVNLSCWSHMCKLKGGI